MLSSVMDNIDRFSLQKSNKVLTNKYCSQNLLLTSVFHNLYVFQFFDSPHHNLQSQDFLKHETEIEQDFITDVSFYNSVQFNSVLFI